MSGEADGLILLPLLLFTPLSTPILIGGAVVAGIAAAGAATDAYETGRQRREAENRRQAEDARLKVADEERRRQADEARRRQNLENERRQREINRVSSAADSIGRSMSANMEEQRRLNAEAADSMTMELENNRRQMYSKLQNKDPQVYRDYIEKIGQDKKRLTENLQGIEDRFVRDYQTKISDSMERITKEVNAAYASDLDDIQKLQNDINAKNKLASEIASDYMEEAKRLIALLENDYEGTKYVPAQLAEIKREYNDAARQSSIGNYEAAIAVAKSVTLDAMEEIYKSDCKRQEWENYYRMALVLSAEFSAYLKGQETITEDIKKQTEEKIGRTLEDDIVGINIADYTEKGQDGTNRFEYLLKKADEIESMLKSEQAAAMSTDQLREIVDLINSRLYPEASRVVYGGLLNMSNAFSRQNISEDIIDFFEEHNFEFTGYSYDDEQHDGALHIGLANDATGEEIIVTLAPELMENGDVQTKVEIDQLGGDETNEDRKAFYRESVSQCVADKNPGSQIQLTCRKGTRNKLSDKTQLRDKLQQ